MRVGLGGAAAVFFLSMAPSAGAQSPVRFFDAPVVPLGLAERFQTLLDFNGDGLPDALSVYGNNAVRTTVVLFRGDGTGAMEWLHFYEHLAPSSPAYCTGARANLNGDAFDDFIVFTTHSFHVYLGSPSGGSLVLNQSFAPTATAFELRAAVVADADGDGDDDVCIRTASDLRYFRFDGGTTFVPAGVLALPGGIVGALEARDMNGDSVPEFLLARTILGTSSELLTYSAHGGTLFPDPAYAIPGLVMTEYAYGDLDGDGDDDLVLCGAEPPQSTRVYMVLRRTGTGTFALETAAIVGGPLTGFADVDQDGDLDGVCCGGGGGGGGAPPVVPNTGASKFEISINTGGVLAPAFSIPSIGAVRLAAAEDLNGDGFVDLVGGRCIYYASGPILKNPLLPGRTATGVQDPFGMGVADLDSDGDADLDVGFTATAGVWANDGTGAIAAWQPTFPTAPVNSIYTGPGLAGDWDGDGDIDLIVEQRTNGNYHSTRLLRNTGGGGFSPAVLATNVFQRMWVPPATGSDIGIPRAAAFSADLDGDGDLDLVMRWNNNGVGSSIWTNNGSGIFTQTAVYFDVYALGAADLNGDGRPDLVEMHGAFVNTQTPFVRRSAAGGGFSTPIPISPAAPFVAGTRVAFGDFDGDGDLDVAHGHEANINFVVNDGSGVLTGSQTILYLLGQAAASDAALVTADFDADGKTDLMALAVGNVANGRTFYRRTGPFQFAGVTQLVAADAFRDIDGDGDLDAVGTTIARNLRFREVGSGLCRQYGQGFPGTGGMTPVIGNIGPFRPGVFGTLRMRGGRGGAQALLMLGDGEANQATPFGGAAYTTIDAFVQMPLGGPANAAGRGWLDIGWFMPVELAGLTIYHQFAVFDSGAAFGVAATGGMQVTVGN